MPSTPLEPVSVEDLARLRELTAARDNVAHKYLSLELEKIPVLAAGRRIDEEHDALLRRIMEERGIHPTAMVNVSPTTGEIVVTSSEEAKRDAAIATALAAVQSEVTEWDGPADAHMRMVRIREILERTKNQIRPPG